MTLPISSAFSGPTALNQVALGLPSSTAATSTRSIGLSWISHSPSCTSRSTKRRRRKRSVSAAAIGLSSCIARLARACRLLPSDLRRTMPCRGRKRNTRSATSMCGCCAADRARRSCSCTAPTAFRCGCRCSTCSPRNFEVFVPEHPGFGTSDNPPWMRNIGDLAMYYLDFIEDLSAHPVHLVGQSLGGWAAAEVAVRNCTRLKSLSLLGARRHPHQGHAGRRQLHLGRRGVGPQSLSQPEDPRSDPVDAARPTSRPTSC